MRGPTSMLSHRIRETNEALAAGEPALHVLCYYLVRRLAWRRQEHIEAQARYRARCGEPACRKVGVPKLVNLDQY